MMTMIVTMMVIGMMMMMLVGMKMTETTRRQLASDKSYNAKCLKCAGKDFGFVKWAQPYLLCCSYAKLVASAPVYPYGRCLVVKPPDGTLHKVAIMSLGGC